MGNNTAPILEVTDLVKYFPITKGLLKKKIGAVHAVDHLNFHINPGETLGLVGESGCGKSTTGRTIVSLYKPDQGKILFEGTDMALLYGEKLRKMRQRVQMIFQDPYASLNPRMKVFEVLSEPLLTHKLVDSRAQLKPLVAEMLELVGLSPDFAGRYPHEFSGGQRQRVGIARALMLNPSFIICDEPISALDVSVQAQIVNLLEDLQKKLGLSYLFIAHDLSMIRHISHRVAVMYLGAIVEIGTKDQIYESPAHPYTKAFLSAVTVPDPEVEEVRERILLQGEIPSAITPPSGCRFRTRCAYAQSRCEAHRPDMTQVSPGHMVACHRAGELMGTIPAHTLLSE